MNVDHLDDNELLNFCLVDQQNHWCNFKRRYGFYIVKCEISPYLIMQISDDQIKRLASLLYQKIKENNKSKLLIDNNGDAFSSWLLLFYHKISKELIDVHQMDAKNFYLLIGAAPHEINLSRYDDICKKYNFRKLNLIFFNGLEAAYNLFYQNIEPPMIDLSGRLKQKKFLCFNRTPRHSRVALTSELIKENLLEKSYFSTIGFAQFNFFYKERHNKYFPNLADSIEETMVAASKAGIIPCFLNHKRQDDQPKHNSDLEDFELYQQSYFSVVTESKFLRDIENDQSDFIKDVTLDCYFFTEKTWRPIRMFHPFIMVGRPGSLKILRDMGYRTFHPFIDESYDNIEDDEQRLLAIVAEIKRLCNFSNEEWIDFQNSVKNLVIFNNQKLRKVYARFIYDFEVDNLYKSK